MLKFSEFLNNRIFESDVDILNAATRTSPATTALTLSAMLQSYISKHKNTGTTTSGSTIDNLSLKVTNFEVNQKVRILTQQGTYIDAIIVSGAKGQTRKFKLKGTSIEGIKEFLKPDQSSNLTTATGQQIPPTEKIIYFKPFKSNNPQETRLKFFNQNGTVLQEGVIGVIITGIQTNF